MSDPRGPLAFPGVIPKQILKPAEGEESLAGSSAGQDRCSLPSVSPDQGLWETKGEFLIFPTFRVSISFLIFLNFLFGFFLLLLFFPLPPLNFLKSC